MMNFKMLALGVAAAFASGANADSDVNVCAATCENVDTSVDAGAATKCVELCIANHCIDEGSGIGSGASDAADCNALQAGLSGATTASASFLAVSATVAWFM
jgi:hypothetical protein